jgi:hypothetical protein
MSELVCIYRNSISYHETDEYVAEKSGGELVLEVVNREKVDVTNLKYLGKQNGENMDYFIEHNAIHLLDLTNKKFVFSTEKK